MLPTLQNALPFCGPMDDDQIARIDAASMDILEDIGVVFRDPSARKDLEAIIHPRVRAAMLTQIETAARDRVSVILDVPLLIENGLVEQCDLCVFVDSSEAARRARARQRGWDDGELARREANQEDLHVKKTRAAYIIHNDGSLEQTDEQVRELLRSLENEQE